MKQEEFRSQYKQLGKLQSLARHSLVFIYKMAQKMCEGYRQMLLVVRFWDECRFTNNSFGHLHCSLMLA